VTLKRIAAPPVAEIATGLTVLVHLAPLAFSPFSDGFYARATFADEGRAREGVWFYRIREGAWSSSVNGLVSDALDKRAVDLLELAPSVRDGITELVVHYREVPSIGGVTDEPLDRVAVIRGSEVLELDLIGAIAGESPNAPIDRMLATADGRFVALQTLASNLVPAGEIDSNACADIYLIDRERATIRRVTVQNGLEIAADAFLEDIRLGTDGVLSVAFTTADSGLSISDRNELNDVFVWKLPSASSQAPGAATIALVSVASGQAQGGSSGLLSARGVMFESDSAAFSSLDVNAASDIWLGSLGGASAPTAALPIALGLPGGMSLVDTDVSGDRVLVSGRSSAFGLNGLVADQLALINLRNSTLTALSVSESGQAADDSVLGAVISPDGRRAVFSTAASNLAESPAESAAGLYLYSPAAAGVLSGAVTYWKNGAPIENVTVRAAAPSGQALPLTDRSNPDGKWQIEGLEFEPYSLNAYRSSSGSGALNAVSAADVLATLKLSVGRNPNADPDGTMGQETASAVSPYQYLAADFDRSGAVSAADALMIARVAASPNATNQPDWRFVAEGVSLDAVNRYAAGWPSYVSVDLNQTEALGWVGVLAGDVDGSWTDGLLDSLLGVPQTPLG
jgi:hypothetical protein